jgi:hypothetical protein
MGDEAQAKTQAEQAKRDSLLHRPTRSQEANGKSKSVGLFRSE